MLVPNYSLGTHLSCALNFPDKRAEKVSDRFSIKGAIH